MAPGLGGLEDCESPATRLETKEMFAEKYLVRYFLSSQRALGWGDLDNAYWPPGAENPANGLRDVRGDMVPLLGILEPDCLSPGPLRPLEGAAWGE